MRRFIAENVCFAKNQKIKDNTLERVHSEEASLKIDLKNLYCDRDDIIILIQKRKLRCPH